MKRAALYARVSSEKQEKERTIESQIAELKRQIAKAGDILVKEYIDDGHSGTSLDRPAMNELREDLKRDIFDVIYILHIDRLSRDLTNHKIVITEIFAHKKQLIINGRDCMDDLEHKFEMTILAAVAEFEREKILERHNRGRMYRLRQGQLMSNGQRIFGYKYIRRTNASLPRLEISENEAKIVRDIFNMYAGGETSFKAIAERLKKEGFTKERISLSGDQVRYILKNEAYAGTRYFNTMGVCYINQGPGHKKKRVFVRKDRSEWIGIPVPAIVSKELFEKVQKQLVHNRECFRNAKGTQPLSNLIFCAACKRRCQTFRKFYAVKRTHKTTYYDRRYFKCRVCNNPQIDARILESQVREIIRENLLDPEKLRVHLDFLRYKRRGSHQIEKEVGNTTQKLKHLVSQKERIVDLYARNDIEQSEYYKRISEYDTKARELEITKQKLLRQLPLFAKPELIRRSVIEHSAKVRACFETSANTNTWRQFFLEFVDKVEYDKRLESRVKFSLHGSIPVVIQLSEGSEEIKIGFTIKKIVSSKEIEIALRDLNSPNAPTHSSRIEIPRMTYLTASHIV